MNNLDKLKAMLESLSREDVEKTLSKDMNNVSVTMADVYPADEHNQAEECDTEGVIEDPAKKAPDSKAFMMTEDIFDALNKLSEDDLDRLLEELESGAPQATEKKEPSEADLSVKNDEVYCKDRHEQAEECDTEGVIEDPASRALTADEMEMTNEDDLSKSDVNEENVEPEYGPTVDPDEYPDTDKTKKEKDKDENKGSDEEDEDDEKYNSESDDKDEKSKKDEVDNIEEAMADIFKTIRESSIPEVQSTVVKEPSEGDLSLKNDDIYCSMTHKQAEECDTEGVIEDPASRALTADEMEMTNEEFIMDLLEGLEDLDEDDQEYIFENLLADEVYSEILFEAVEEIDFENLNEALGNRIRQTAGKVKRFFQGARDNMIPSFSAQARTVRQVNRDAHKTANAEINTAYGNYGSNKKAAKAAIKAERADLKGKIKSAKTPEERIAAANAYATKLRQTGLFGKDNAKNRARVQRDNEINAAKNKRDAQLLRYNRGTKTIGQKHEVVTKAEEMAAKGAADAASAKYKTTKTDYNDASKKYKESGKDYDAATNDLAYAKGKYATSGSAADRDKEDAAKKAYEDAAKKRVAATKNYGTTKTAYDKASGDYKRLKTDATNTTAGSLKTKRNTNMTTMGDSLDFVYSNLKNLVENDVEIDKNILDILFEELETGTPESTVVKEPSEANLSLKNDDIYCPMSHEQSEECDTDGVIEDPASRVLTADEMEMTNEDIEYEDIRDALVMLKEEYDLLNECDEEDFIEVLDECDEEDLEEIEFLLSEEADNVFGGDFVINEEEDDSLDEILDEAFGEFFGDVLTEAKKDKLKDYDKKRKIRKNQSKEKWTKFGKVAGPSALGAAALGAGVSQYSGVKKAAKAVGAAGAATAKKLGKAFSYPGGVLNMGNIAGLGVGAAGLAAGAAITKAHKVKGSRRKLANALVDKKGNYTGDLDKRRYDEKTGVRVKDATESSKEVKDARKNMGKQIATYANSSKWFDTLAHKRDLKKNDKDVVVGVDAKGKEILKKYNSLSKDEKKDYLKKYKEDRTAGKKLTLDYAKRKGVGKHNDKELDKLADAKSNTKTTKTVKDSSGKKKEKDVYEESNLSFIKNALYTVLEEGFELDADAIDLIFEELEKGAPESTTVKEPSEADLSLKNDDIYCPMSHEQSEECDTDGVIEDPASRALTADEMEMTNEEIEDLLDEAFDILEADWDEVDDLLESYDCDQLEDLAEAIDFIEEFIHSSNLNESKKYDIAGRGLRRLSRNSKKLRKKEIRDKWKLDRESMEKDAEAQRDILRAKKEKLESDLSDGVDADGKEITGHYKRSLKRELRKIKRDLRRSSKGVLYSKERDRIDKEEKEKRAELGQNLENIDDEKAARVVSRVSKVGETPVDEEKAKPESKKKDTGKKTKEAKDKKTTVTESSELLFNALHSLVESGIEIDADVINTLFEELETGAPESTVRKEPSETTASKFGMSAVYGSDEHTQSEECDTDGVIEDPRTRGLESRKYEKEDLEKMLGIKESAVAYNSLKEAFMLEDSYFSEDSYVKITPDAKAAKLEEQIALIMCKESNDPMFAELLKHANYVKNLTEACKKKYPAAKNKAKEFLGAKKK